MARVATTYDPSTRELIIDTAVSSDWTDWLAAHTAYHNTNDPASEREYLYLRVWDRGDDTTSDPEILYTKNVALDLGDTGLSVTVTADGMPGDFWIIAARPSTPDVVTPWDLGDAAAPVAPHGPRRFYTPLATINWNDNGVSVTPTVLDCRAKLTPLCASSGCCTVTVGDGKTSHGTVSTLQDAIDVVPDGGKICILPGTHEGTAVVADRSDIVIEGCGVTSVLANPVPSSGSTDFEAFYDAVLRIEDSSNITVRDVGIQAFSAVGVEVVQDDGVCKDIRLEGLTTHATGTFAPPVFDLPAPGINVIGAREVDIVGCRVISADVLGYEIWTTSPTDLVELLEFQADVFHGEMAPWALGLGTMAISDALTSWQGLVKPRFFEWLLEADGKIEAANGNKRSLLAARWAWEREYGAEAWAMIGEELVKHAEEMAAFAVVITAAQHIPYVNVAVDIALLGIAIYEAVKSAQMMYQAEQAVRDATTVVDLQRAAAQRALSNRQGGAAILLELMGGKAGVKSIRSKVKIRPSHPIRPRSRQVFTNEYQDWFNGLDAKTQGRLRMNPELRATYEGAPPHVRRLLTKCAGPCLPANVTPQDIAAIERVVRNKQLDAASPELRDFLGLRDSEWRTSHAAGIRDSIVPRCRASSCTPRSSESKRPGGSLESSWT